MKNFAAKLLLAFLFLAPVAALAQSSGKVVTDCTTGVPLAYPVGSNSVPAILPTGKACVDAAVSVAGFAPATTGTPISVTTGGVTGTLPAGAAVVATNVGTTQGAYCKLGASATTSDQFISPNGGWFAFTVGAATQLTCITSTGTTTVNMVGGAGIATGTGGGGGGSGGAVTLASGAVASGAYSSGSIASGAYASGSIGSGAVASGALASGSIASGAMAAGSHAAGAGVDGWDLTQGAIADAAVTAGATGSVSAKLRSISRDVGTVATNSALPLPVQTGIGNVNIGAVQSAGSAYETVAASQTAQALGATGATGDYLSHCVIYPTSTTPGVVTVFDNANAAATNVIAFPGGASSVSNLAPIALPVGALSTAGAWKVTTGANVSVICYGKFT